MTFSSWLDSAPEWEHREVQRHLHDPNANDLKTLSTPDGSIPLEEAREARTEGKPLEYILGHVHVGDVELSVDSRVLIPRPETETLVRRFVDEAVSGLPPGPIVDCGTGSGLIAALLTELQDRPVVGIDRYEDPLAVARGNLQDRKGVTGLLRGDRLSMVRSNSVAAVLANLPYVRADSPDIQQSVRKYEPAGALHVEGKLTTFYDETIKQLARVLRPEGEAWLELSPSLVEEFRDNTHHDNGLMTRTEEDLAGTKRFLRIECPGS